MNKVLWLFVLVAAVAAEVPKSHPCSDVEQDACIVHEIRVNPCKEINTCNLRKGSNATIEVDFTPNFTSDDLKTGMFWPSSGGDVPFSDLQNADACKYATCPFEIGQTNKYALTIYISTRLPNGKFPLKWKLWDAANENKACCFKLSVNLKKGKAKKH